MNPTVIRNWCLVLGARSKCCSLILKCIRMNVRILSVYVLDASAKKSESWCGFILISTVLKAFCLSNKQKLFNTLKKWLILLSTCKLNKMKSQKRSEAHRVKAAIRKCAKAIRGFVRNVLTVTANPAAKPRFRTAWTVRVSCARSAWKTRISYSDASCVKEPDDMNYG
jgi:hypothetical protein